MFAVFELPGGVSCRGFFLEAKSEVCGSIAKLGGSGEYACLGKLLSL